MIAGHTHRPVFGTSKPPKPALRPIAEIERELDAAKATGDRDRVATLRAELEWTEVVQLRVSPPVPIQPPCYFNTGCCCFPDGDITALELADGEIRLVRWPTDDGKAAPKLLVKEDLREVLATIRRGDSTARSGASQ
jgi:hypothetical protein